MGVDIPLTDFFECPSCGCRGLFKAEPAAYVKCLCGRWWVIGDYKYFKSLSREEREKMRTWDVNSCLDHRESNHNCFGVAGIYS